MSFVDISPANQPFSHAFRPFSFQWQEAQNKMLCHIIYGFGEYQFTADLTQHDSKADFLHLLPELEAGSELAAVIYFATSKENIFLQLRGQGEVIFFSWQEEKEGEKSLLLEGETNREYLLSLTQSLEK